MDKRVVMSGRAWGIRLVVLRVIVVGISLLAGMLNLGVQPGMLARSRCWAVPWGW
jgi:hypothetical protein